MRMRQWRFRMAAVPLAVVVSGLFVPSAFAQADCPWGAAGASPGMMGGGYGMGPGMMGGGGGMMGMMGPGMMGSGMMGGGYGMGPGMMGGFGTGPIAALDLSEGQRQKIRDIQTEQRKLQWELAGKILDEQAQLNEVYASDTPDPKKAGAIYGRIAKLQQQQLEAQLSAHNRIQAVLTKEQREQLKQWQGGYARGGTGAGTMTPGPGMMRR